jgi:predicted HD phosphohydrolase
MSAAEIAGFEATAHWRDAVKLRRYDERAKVPGLDVPQFSAYAGLIGALARDGA